MCPVENESETLGGFPSDDTALDSFLEEIVGGVTMTDQRQAILRRFHEIENIDKVPTNVDPVRSKESPWSARPVTFWSTLLAIAASLLLLWGLRPFFGPLTGRVVVENSDSLDSGDTEVSRAPNGPRLVAPTNVGTDLRTTDLVDPDLDRIANHNENASDRKSTNRRASGRGNLPLGSVPFEYNGSGQEPKGALAASQGPLMSPPPKLQSRQEIVDQVDAYLRAAWKELSVSQAVDAEPLVVAKRIERITGVRLPTTKVNLVSVSDVFQSSEARQQVSAALVDGFLGPTDGQTDDAAWRNHLVQAFERAFDGKQGFDQIVRGLFVQDQGLGSGAWLEPVSGRDASVVVEQTAHALLDMDLRCSRCHDHPIQKQLQQQEYWNLVALFARNQGSAKEKGLFYDLSDGRRRLAVPSVRTAWLGANEGPMSVSEVDRLADYWIASPRLAQATVNRLWEVVYGRPLVGAVSDPNAPLRNEHLIELRAYLGEQLRAHQYDLASAMTWILAAKPMRLAVPPIMDPLEGVETTVAKRADADLQLRAFAAYQPLSIDDSFSAMMAEAKWWSENGSVNLSSPFSTLAQPKAVDSTELEAVSSLSPAERHKRRLRSTLLYLSASDVELPAQWLARIEGFDEQARHLFYTAGYRQPTKSQMLAAKELRKANNDSIVTLKLLWWALSGVNN